MQDFFVVNAPETQGFNLDIWGSLTSGDRIYNMSQGESAENVSANVGQWVSDAVSNYTCTAPPLPVCDQMMDIVFVIHRSNCNPDNNTQAMINNLTVILSREFDLDGDLTHVAVLSYDANNMNVPPGDSRRVLVPLARYNRSYFEDAVNSITSIPCVGTTANSPESVLDVLYEFLGNYSSSGDRSDAPNSVIIITDQPLAINDTSIMAAATKLNDTQLNSSSVFIAIDDSCNCTTAGAQNGTRYDPFSAFFPFKTTQIDQDSLGYGFNQKSAIRKFVCVPKPRPVECPCTGLGTCPATNKTSPFYNDEHSLFFYN